MLLRFGFGCLAECTCFVFTSPGAAGIQQSQSKTLTHAAWKVGFVLPCQRIHPLCAVVRVRYVAFFAHQCTGEKVTSRMLIWRMLDAGTICMYVVVEAMLRLWKDTACMYQRNKKRHRKTDPDPKALLHPVP